MNLAPCAPLAAIVVAACLAAGSAAAADFPQFRGAGGQGHAEAQGLPVQWSDAENVRWKANLPGEGWSSPITLGRRIYLTAAVPIAGEETKDRSLRTLCLDAETGKILWDKEVFQQDDESTERIHPKNSHASPTPLTDGEHVFVHFGAKGTACLTLDGDIVWKTQELVYRPHHGNGGSPILVDGRLIVSCDGIDIQFVVALDAATGEIAWKKDRPDLPSGKRFSFSTPLAIEVNGKTQVISPATDCVVAYDPVTGEEIWVVRYEGYSVIPRPVFGHGLVYLSTSYNNATLLAIRPDGKGDVTDTHVEWKLTRGAPHTPSPLLVGDELYLVSDRGIATCVNARTGEMYWQERVPGNYSASPLYADGKIYLQNETGEATVLKPGREYVELARNTLPNTRTLASYAVLDSSLLIRTDTQLLRIEGTR